MSSLVEHEKEFANYVLKSKEAKVFYRSWRKRAANEDGTWSAIRDASFSVSGKDRFGKSIVKSLRNHLYKLQKGRCCYCRRYLDGIAYAQPIEHILSQNDYRKFTFYYRNLAVSCFNCNHSKTSKNWSNWPLAANKYIVENKCKDFFHPRLHDYHEHINYVLIETNSVSISVYAGLTAQGRHLCSALLKNSARRNISLSSNQRLNNAIDKLRNQIEKSDFVEEDSELLAFMKALELAADPV